MGKTGTAPGTLTLTLPGGRSVQAGRWVDDRQWTTVELQTGDTDTLNAFTAGKSQQITGGGRMMSLMDTNVEANGTSGHPKSWQFMVYSIGMEFRRATRLDVGGVHPLLTSYSDPVTLRTFFELMRRLFNRYKYNDRVYAEGHVVDFPQGYGPAMFTTNAATEIVNNGNPDARSKIAMVLPIDEEELLSYYMEVTPVIALAIAQPAADGGTVLSYVDLRITKHGLIQKNVG